MKQILILLSLLIVTGCGSNKSKTDEVKPPRIGMHVAVVQGNVEAVKQHIAAGSDLNVKDEHGGSTPLISASLFGKTEIAKALIDGGADLNAQNNEGSTALMTASVFCRPEIVKYLLENGADKSIKNNHNVTPVQAVSTPFENAKPVYDFFIKALGPLGLQLDYDYLEKTRPEIANMLK